MAQAPKVDLPSSAVERLNYWYSDEQFRSLAKLLNAINYAVPAKSRYRSFFHCAFSNILKATSRWLTKSIKPQVDPHKKPVDPWATFAVQFEMMKSAFRQSASLDELEEKLGDNKAAKAAFAVASKLYKQERAYLIQRAESTENLAGVGLSVETAAHDLMAVMHRGIVALDALIAETQKHKGALDKDHMNRELNYLRGMFSFVEAQLKDIQLLFKSTKQRRKDIRVKDIVQKVQKIFDTAMRKENIVFEIIEQGSPLVAKTTDAVLPSSS